MAGLGGLGKKITDTGHGAYKKTKNVADALKLNNQIAESERAVSAYCDIIGREYYLKHASGGWDPDFDEMFIGIIGEKEKIVNCKIQLRAMRGVVECPGCGRELASDMNFCSHCGTKLVIPVFENVPKIDTPYTYALESEDAEEEPADQEDVPEPEPEE